jgi:hypothetical protein
VASAGAASAPPPFPESGQAVIAKPATKTQCGAVFAPFVVFIVLTTSVKICISMRDNTDIEPTVLALEVEYLLFLRNRGLAFFSSLGVAHSTKPRHTRPATP